MTHPIDKAQTAAILASEELRAVIAEARRFAASTGHPVDDLDDAHVLAGLRRLSALVAASTPR